MGTQPTVPRILVVSEEQVLAETVASAGYRVVALTPDQLGAWLAEDHDPLDAVLLDSFLPGQSFVALGQIQAAGRRVAVLLLERPDPRMSSPSLRLLPGIAVLPLPATYDHIFGAIADLLYAADDATVIAQPGTAPTSPPAATGSVRDAVAAAVDRALAEPEIGRRLTVKPTMVRVAPPDVGDADTAVVPVQVPASPEEALPPEAEAALERPIEPAAGQLATLLAERTDDLAGVAETAQVIVEQALELTGADSAALLVPDGQRWRVAADIGLRPVERRLELLPDSWLVTQVAQPEKGLLIEGTDIARRQLAGAPLASRKHLLAVAIPGSRALLLLARRADPAFVERNLDDASVLCKEAQAYLADALTVRSAGAAAVCVHRRGPGLPAAGPVECWLLDVDPIVQKLLVDRTALPDRAGPGRSACGTRARSCPDLTGSSRSRPRGPPGSAPLAQRRRRGDAGPRRRTCR